MAWAKENDAEGAIFRNYIDHVIFLFSSLLPDFRAFHFYVDEYYRKSKNMEL
jgi:hypothetical protein